MPKVTVLLTSYNHAPFLREAIDSVLAQSFADFELIIWDDHSTDNSWEIIQSYRDHRIKTYRNPENMGPVFGINKAIFEVAVGEFVAVHHSDDVWVEHKLARQLACFDQVPDLGAVFSHVQAIAEEGFDLDDSEHLVCQVFEQLNRTRHQWLRHFFLHGNALCHPSALVRRRVYAECGPYDEALWQLPDFDMWVRVLLRHEIHVIPDKLVKFRVLSADANTSGDRPDARIQWEYEFPLVLEHYRKIATFADVCAVFPEAARHDRGPNTDTQYALGRAALDVATLPQSQLFALNLLRDARFDTSRGELLKQYYGFSVLDFHKLTRKHDVYLRETCRSLNEDNAQFVEANDTLKQRIVELELQKTYLNQSIAGFEYSVSWRISKPVRLIGGAVRAIKATGAQVGDLKLFIKRQGGVCRALSEAWAILQRNGFLRRQVPQVEINPGSGSGKLDRNDYTAWVLQYDTLDSAKSASLAESVAALGHRPLISVVLITHHPDLPWLQETVDAMRRQIYPNWELCIADDASADHNVKTTLENLANSDSRIRIVCHKQQGGQSAAANSALSLATGQWVALLDQHDLLPADALARVAEAINRRPDAGVIYTDEDKINSYGNRCSPNFKPDWNPDLFLVQNYIGHLAVFRKADVDAVAGFRLGFEGAHDYDLALRVIERLKPGQIIHIPRVLYHQRLIKGGIDSTQAAQAAALRAVTEHLQRTDIPADVEPVGGQQRIRYRLPERLPLVSIIIPTRNALALVRQCIDSILKKTTYSNFEILLVDNASDDPEALAYFEMLGQTDRMRVIRDERPFNYSALNNNAVAQAEGELIALVNNDIEVITPNWLEEMVSIALQPSVGAVGACLWYPDDTLQHGGVILGISGNAGHSQKGLSRGCPGYHGRGVMIQSYSAVTAACLVVKKDRYLKVGGLNEKYLSVAFNDVDFCLKLREAGYRSVWTPYAELYHHESATRGKEDTPEKLERASREASYMQRRWKKIIANDPGYSPNLTLCHEDFSLAWPPRV